MDVAQDVSGLGQAPKGGERLGDPVGRAGAGQALHDDVRRGQAILQRGDNAHELVPLLDNDVEVDRARAAAAAAIHSRRHDQPGRAPGRADP